jgi:uncharacterized membrane protein
MRAPAKWTSPIRAKHLVFALIGLMILIVLNKDRVIADPRDPIWQHYHFFKWWLIPHGLAAITALFLGPLQFSDRLRRNLPRHRLIGRIYVGAVAAAIPVGLTIETIKIVHGVAPPRLLVATSGYGLVFGLATTMGFLMARRRNIVSHRRWMTRSYAIALVFLTGRVVDATPWLSKIAAAPSDLLESHHVSDLWMYIVLSLFAAEVVIRCEALLNRPRPPRLRPRVATAA